MNFKKLLSFSLLIFIGLGVYAQNQPNTPLHIKKAVDEIKLDGLLDEKTWQDADVAKDFYVNYPYDTALAQFQTEFRVSFDEDFIYLAFIAHDDTTADMVNSLRRDFNYDLNDNVGVVFSPFNDKQNGFFFITTPKGVQMEGIMNTGGANNDSWSIFWDCKWYNKVVRYKDKWVGEMAIPFKSFRYKSDISEWNIAFDRYDAKRNTKSAWIRTPIQFPTASMAYAGQLMWDDPIPKSKRNISVIPYVAGGLSNEAPYNTSPNGNLSVGFDAKAAITPSLSLDLTVNPDFSQVEVDRQVINLTRFEFQFPERRQFFLENSDLFANAGFPGVRPFFSRRIGLVQDSIGLYQQVPIAFGARISGSLNEKWRISVMNMQTKEMLSQGLPAQNYGVATILRNLGSQSSFSFTFVNKQSLGVAQGDSLKYFHNSIFGKLNGAEKERTLNLFNRTFTADLELLSKDFKWYFSTYATKSLDEEKMDKSGSVGYFAKYATRQLTITQNARYLGENYNPEAGFAPALRVYPGQLSHSLGVQYKFFPKAEKLVFMGPKGDYSETYLPDGTLTDRVYALSYSFNFLNTSAIELSANHVFQKLTNNFSLADASIFESFQKNEEYKWNTVSLAYKSSTIKKVNYAIETLYGGFYNGTNFNISGQLNARYQPIGNISLLVDYNDLKLPESYGGAEKLFLIGPRIDLTLTKKIFLTTYVQYNNLLDNVNINGRFQWRYSPASDFFIVYTENYFANNFNSKNRALVFKLNYWLNL